MTTASDSRPPAFHVMAKPRGAICNLGCEYCYYLPKKALYPDSTFRMSNQVLKSYVRQYIAAQQVPQIHFAWQGGEPTLMGLDFFRRVVGYQKEAARPGMRIENAIQTNGTLLNDDWCRFFAENHFLVGISLDGPREMHDVYRKDKGNRGTFDRVIHGIRLLKDYQVDFNILTCVSAANAEKPLEVYHFLRDEVGAEFIQFIPIVEWERPTDPQKERKLSERSVNGEQYGYFLNSIFDDWLAHDLSKIFVQIFDTSFGHWIGAPGGLCVFQETCGLALVTEHNGDVYSCDHFVEPDCYLGNMLKTPLAEMVGSEKQRQFGLAKRNSLPQYCRSCSFLFACNGGCPKDRTDITPDGEPGLNHLCSGFKTFFAHVDSPFRIMANLIRQHRPMTDVMKILENSN
ncbi:MAG: anaerobic sulfatase maturase [Flexilinea sp.]|nr:anaerobic sulfatase maturase [Flexilinea sp.]